jgi:ankyrin repeat protein
MVVLLLKNGADVNGIARDDLDKAIFSAVLNVNFELVDLLLKHGADINICQWLEDENALMALISNYEVDSGKRKDIIKMIKNVISLGINIDQAVWYGNSLLVYVQRKDI